MTDTNAQDNQGYQMPPKAIADLVDAPRTPGVSLSPDNQWMLFLDRPSMPDIEEVAQEELRLAGIRINPRTNGSSRSTHYNNIALRTMTGDKLQYFEGMPAKVKIENLGWSPDGSKIAFTNTISGGMELWVGTIKEQRVEKLTGAIINDAMSGSPYRWCSDNQSILYKTVDTNRGQIPVENSTPSGPVIQKNEGASAPVRTYQDLLKTPHDEAVFEYFTNAQLVMVNVDSRKETKIGKVGITKSFSLSPDGNYIVVQEVKRPYSYIVPYSRFPFEVNVYDRQGKLVHQVADIPLSENIPKGFGATRKGPRSFTWRNDVAATLYWVEAQDGGDPKKEAAVRDKMFYLEAPFTGKAKTGIDFKLRYGGVTWGDNDLAIAYEWWWPNRQEITSTWNPSKPMNSKSTLFDRSWEDKYNDPGNFETSKNKYGRFVLLTDELKNNLYLMGQGASEEGNRPFVDAFDLKTKQSKRLWRSEAPYYEFPISILEENNGLVLTRRESNTEPPNYYLRNINSGSLDQITSFENPYKALEKVSKELIQYKRADGVELSGTLYLPEGYDKEKDGPLPVLMWAYPREYKSADAAGQVSDSPYEFIRIYWASPIYWVTQGYAVFDGFGMPIIGEGDAEPNETFVEQLVADAEAAINTLVDLGVADRDRLGVGGHSYGAFMTANLLAHSDLFAAGIARSGAYNRTLTPFGFQSEERTLWEAADTYAKMSPFMYADKIKEPLLLIHGAADNNSGTYPMQSERFYGALKGHGATVRLVMLPHESHSYRARESIMHMLWEMTTWMDKYVKNKEVVTKP